MNVEISYNIEGKDILTYQLYYASKNMADSKFRKVRDILVPFFCIIIGILSNELHLRIINITFGILWFIGYPSFEKWFYKKKCNWNISEHYRDHLTKSVTLNLSQDTLWQKLWETESSFPVKSIIEVIELSDIIIMRINNGSVTIIPKDKIKPGNTFIEVLKDLCLQNNIPYNENITWMWE